MEKGPEFQALAGWTIDVSDDFIGAFITFQTFFRQPDGTSSDAAPTLPIAITAQQADQLARELSGLAEYMRNGAARRTVS